MCCVQGCWHRGDAMGVQWRRDAVLWGCDGAALVQGCCLSGVQWGSIGCQDAGSLGVQWRCSGAGMQAPCGCIGCRHAGTMGMRWGCIGAGMLSLWGAVGKHWVPGCWQLGGAMEVQWCRDAGTVRMHWVQACRHHGDAMGVHWCRDAGTTAVPGPAAAAGPPRPLLVLPMCGCSAFFACTVRPPCSSRALRPPLLEQHVGLCTQPTHAVQRWDFPRGWGCHAAPPADLEALLADLSSFLLLLDRENLSAAARAKKQSVGELLQRLQGPAAEDAEYMMMRCLSPSSGVRQCRDGAGELVLCAEL
ncbi:uncharacterized protein LOC109364597 isoform X2 [Meleagris gallopavo]|uniref:uncharacterized protein LOC109364597 isoform X2 n=1 Tax=Meleagris gallopavo TaxID=9103 RepID=UPI000938EAB3|nr:uncharacterized protein LOC109364597 isoform X2 [Meleagris gallopavo]